MTTTERGSRAGPGTEPAPSFRHFIAGEWCDSTSGETFGSRNPADTRDVIAD